MTRTRTATMAAMAVAIVMAFAQPVRAIGPSVLMFYGDPLKAPVFVTGADVDAFGDLIHPSSVSASELAGRPFIKVALFWGTLSNPSGRGVKMADLKPEMGSQQGRFFPPTATQGAVLLVTQYQKGLGGGSAPESAAAYTTGGPVPAAAVSILQRVGVLKATGR